MTSSSGTVVIIVCDTEPDQIKWRDAGVGACAGKAECNAWFWLDRAVAPKSAPISDGEIPRAAVNAARAVWVNETQQLILLRKVK